MTERQGEHSDDQASPAPRPPEFPEGFANPSGPVPRRPEPPSAENDTSGDPAPGLGGGALRGDAPSSDPLTFEKVFKWPEQPGPQHKPVAQDPSPPSDRFPSHEQQPSDTAARPGEPALPMPRPSGRKMWGVRVSPPPRPRRRRIVFLRMNSSRPTPRRGPATVTHRTRGPFQPGPARRGSGGRAGGPRMIRA